VIDLVMTGMVVTAVVAAVNAPHPAAVVDRPLLVAVSTLHARMTAATVTVTTMTAADLEVLMIATGRWRMTVDVKTIAKTAPMATIEKVYRTPAWLDAPLLIPVVAIESPPPAHDELDTAE
jgi:hypothetical protein